MSDHSLELELPTVSLGETRLEALFQQRRTGSLLSDAEVAQLQLALLQQLGRVYAAEGWSMCLHIGAQRNNSRRMFARLGPDSGFDSMADAGGIAGLAHLLDTLDSTNELPRTLLFNLNPNMNAALATLAGNYQQGPVLGKVQFGPAWWFNDHKAGNQQQLCALANHGLLGSSVGMLTDSRSFASYPRHEYFRRVLCQQLGAWVENGEYPADMDALSHIVQSVCHDNARDYFRL